MIKRTLSRFHVYLLWALVSVFLWSYVFSFLTDTGPQKKLSLYVSTEQVQDVELAAQLEEGGLPDGIRMIKVHPFSYAMFSDRDLLSADLYVVKASEAEGWHDSFRPLPDGLAGDLDLGDGVCGIRVYDAERGVGAFDELIGYSAPGAAGEDYYLFFGAESQHTEEDDGAALWLAQRFLEGSH
ncbi:MAG: hypothetical protein IJG45_05710 [Oscillospiraceae bacterium]|nr:hypothetical protein [Oscillospiraceae bacterium]